MRASGGVSGKINIAVVKRHVAFCERGVTVKLASAALSKNTKKERRKKKDSSP